MNAEHKPVYRLTAQEWDEHVAHRIRCRDELCDRFPHHYVKAIEDGRVFVGGLQMGSYPPLR